ncbi:MAG: hypothetical protein K0S32_1369 [Bacteroidetes bacterium]|jgi:hypothetical protein|nr:hypothetical protein [Bacteroidota bacterium]
MKTTKIILLVIALIVVAMISNAQNSKTKNSSSSSGGKCFNENSKVLNLGVGFWSHYYRKYGRGNYAYHSSPVFNLSYEQSLKQQVGPGFLGVGAFLGYQRTYLRYDDYYYKNNRYYWKQSWTYSYIAFRAAYHADALMTDKAELYFGANAGLRFSTYRFETNTDDPDVRIYDVKESTIYPAWALFVGGRFYFTDNIGIFGELGYGMSWLTVGASIKF